MMYCFISHNVKTLFVLSTDYLGEEEKDGLKKEANKKGEKDTTTCVCCSGKSEDQKKEGETKYSKVGCACCSESSEDSTPSPVKVGIC